MIQAAKVIRIFTMFFFLIILLLIYAYMPLTIDINMDGFDRIGREFFFYSSLGTFVLIVLSTYLFRSLADKSGLPEYQRLLIHLLPSIVIFSLTLLVGYLGIINNSRDINPETYNYLNYLSAGLVIVWIFSFLFTLIRKI